MILFARCQVLHDDDGAVTQDYGLDVVNVLENIVEETYSVLIDQRGGQAQVHANILQDHGHQAGTSYV